MERCRPLLVSAMALCLATGAGAYEPALPCTGVFEAGMVTGNPEILGNVGFQNPTSGVVVESYEDPRFNLPDRTDAPPQNVEALKGFRGYRVTHCASGRFLTVTMGTKTPYIYNEVYGGLAQTEFLRDDVQNGRKVGYPSLRKAVIAVFSQKHVQEFRETAETCGCHLYFPELRPASMTPYDQRGDVDGYSK